MKAPTTTAGIVALSAAILAEAQSTPPTSTTKTIFLPSRASGARGNVYASVITESSSTTKYLLACQTDFKPPYTCEGDFKGVTLTYGESAIEVAFGATAYDCDYGKTAVCQTRTATSGAAGTITVDASAMSTWMTPITVLATQTSPSNSTTTAAAATTTEAVCKRSLADLDDDEDDDDVLEARSSNNKKKKKKKTKYVAAGDDCSAGTLPQISVLGGALALGIGALMNIVL